MTPEDEERELARCIGMDVGLYKGFALCINGSFKYKNGGQGFGYRINDDFIVRLMNVFRVENFREINGRYCFVTHTHNKIHKVEPLFEDEGEVFDVKQWSEDLLKAQQIDTSLRRYKNAHQP